ncbi:MAG: TerC/Alx family metal homeostasis membrane protein [Bacillota bacterium]|nr:TerC/Alx family metal homeostasis membrane protein [Bacillota bacterium]
MTSKGEISLSIKKALTWTAIWLGLALGFNGGIWYFLGRDKALAFLGGYIIEQSLSIDNLFLFIIVFTSFGIKSEHQRRILNYGIAGAIVLRMIFVVLGVTVVNMFHWVLYVFGVILIVSGVKMMLKKEEDNASFKDSKVIKLLGRIIPVSKELSGSRFFVRKNKVLYATPLFAILILIEFTDILFAIDSIPAIFSITTDPFIIYTSNIFAILGLRSMYFVLGRLHEKFKYVKYGVALILTFTGIKLFILIFHISIATGLALAIIFIILAASIAASVLFSGSEAVEDTTL